MDFVYLAVALISFVATIGLLRLCEHLSKEKSGERS
jgi:hypothetical protein